jgi:hypothetical protein
MVLSRTFGCSLSMRSRILPYLSGKNQNRAVSKVQVHFPLTLHVGLLVAS